jgi:hypothetical protein
MYRPASSRECSIPASYSVLTSLYIGGGEVEKAFLPVIVA